MADNGSCPICGPTLAVPPGSTVPYHRKPGEQGTCPGTGSTAN